MMFLFVLAFSLSSFTFAQEPLPWVITHEEPGVRVLKAEVKDDPILYLKGEAVIAAPFTKVAQVILDTTRAHEWVSDLVSSKNLGWIKMNEQYLEYNHVSTPFVLKDRDFLSVVSIQYNTDEIQIHYDDPPNLGSFSEDRVRGSLKGSSFILKNLADSSTYIEAVLHCDPKGAIPKWAVNWFQADWPKETFSGIKRQVQKSDVHEHAFLKKAIETLKTSTASSKKHSDQFQKL